MQRLFDKLFSIIRSIVISVTFIMIPMCLGLIVYYSIVCYDLYRVLMYIAILVVAIYTNKNL